MNNSANNAFKRLKKERTNLLIGMIVIVLIMAISACICFSIERNLEQKIFQSYVSFSSVSTAERFEDLIRGGLAQMEIACADITFEKAGNAVSALTGTDVFSGAALLDKQGGIIAQNGEIIHSADTIKYVKYDSGNDSADICIGSDGSISIRKNVNAVADIRAWIRPERVNAIFSDAAGNAYGYCLYDSATGAYFVNRTHFTEKSYFDALLARNGNGKTEPMLKTWNARSAQTGIDDDAAYPDGMYYIAQARTDIGNICLSVIVPQKQLEALLGINDRVTMYILLTLGAAFLLIFLTAFYFRHRFTKASNAAISAFDMEDRMLRRAANGTQMTLMAYNADTDTFEAYCESDNEIKNNGAPPKTLRAFAERYGIGESEVERMYAACRKLNPDERASLDLNAVRGSDERCLHMHMHAAPDDHGCVICSLHDCTTDALSNEKAQQDAAFRAAMLPKCVSAWEINATNDRWRVSYCAGNADPRALDMAKEQDLWRDYAADLNGNIRAIVHPDDYEAYVGVASANAIVGMYQNGRHENVLEYRVRTANGGDYEWHRQIMRVRRNRENGDIIACLYVVNINAERMAETERRERSRVLQQSLTALGGLYFAMFYVDLDNDLCSIVKAPGGELVAQNRGSYRQIFDPYIERTVHPDDRAMLRDTLSAYLLRKTMTETDHLRTCEYRRLVEGHSKRVMAIVQAARFENGTVRDVVVALRYIGETRVCF